MKIDVPKRRKHIVILKDSLFVFLFLCSEAWRRRRMGLQHLHKQNRQIHRQSDASITGSEKTVLEDQNHRDYDPDEEI